MSPELRRPHEVVDYDALVAAYPPPPEYLETAYLADPETCIDFPESVQSFWVEDSDGQGDVYCVEAA